MVSYFFQKKTKASKVHNIYVYTMLDALISGEKYSDERL